MKIFSSEQIKKWDNYTIVNEPVASIDLMERASTACFNWLIHSFNKNEFKIFCGKGNNGGDGLAVARMLAEKEYIVSVYILESEHQGTQDFQTNLERLQQVSQKIFFIRSAEDIPVINENEVVVDAIFGTGLNKPPGGISALLIEHINASDAVVISIDIPSGLYADKTSKENNIVKADYTLTFQQYKMAFLLAENESYFGKIAVLDIGLNKNFYQQENTNFGLVDKEMIREIYKPRDQFTHKGNYGHACMITGSKGLMGAAVLATNACLRSGAGKVTAFTPSIGYDIMQICAPEAMTKIAGEDFISAVNELEKYDAIGVGPGLGLYETHKNLLKNIFTSFTKPIVIDADALNILSQEKDLLNEIPQHSIITPHTVEFERLFGKTNNDFERIELALQKAHEHEIYIVLKGHHTFIATPGNKGLFNSTGNAGMATGGSGDVLTGVIAGLLAQNYSPLHSCLLGVYLHGLAGDIAAEKLSQEAMIAGDIITNMGEAFKLISSNK